MSKPVSSGTSTLTTGSQFAPPHIRIDGKVYGDLVVVVKCSDRIGRLAEILGVLDVCGLEIRLAKLDSREGEVIDTFHVGPGPSMADLDLTGLEQRIAESVTP